MGPWYIEDTKKWCAKDEGFILVAEASAKLVGYATILTKCEEDGAIDEIAYTYAQVADLVVTQSARRKGIGNALLKACEDKARAAGRKILRIGVLSQNSGAISAYHSFGFAPYVQTLEKILA
jgi:GNAT superfamily N-acetyltransferase